MAASARKQIWGWWFFDWASQPYSTLMLTFVFGPYFAQVAATYYLGQGLSDTAAHAAAQSAWGYGQTLSGVLIALLAPILGAVADQSGRRTGWVWFFSILYVVGAWAVWYLTPQNPDILMALVWFGVGLIGMEFATIFTNAMMPDLTGDEDMGRVSGSGFAFGYLGGIIALAIMLAFFVDSPTTGLTMLGKPPALGLDGATQEGTRSVGPFTAIWYVVFMVPFFLWVKEPKRAARRFHIGEALSDLWRLILSLRTRVSLGAHLISSMFYRDALNALYAFGGIYASGVLGWSIIKIGVFGIVGAIAATLFSWLGGKWDSARGPLPVIKLSMWTLILVCLVIAGMDPSQIYGIPLGAGQADIIFYVCGCLIGAAGGSLQSASRTMMVFHTTPEKATEAFGLYALSGKATAFIAPFLIAITTAISESQRIGISVPLIALFLVGLVLLKWVRPLGERGP